MNFEISNVILTRNFEFEPFEPFLLEVRLYSESKQITLIYFYKNFFLFSAVLLSAKIIAIQKYHKVFDFELLSYDESIIIGSKLWRVNKIGECEATRFEFRHSSGEIIKISIKGHW